MPVKVSIPDCPGVLNATGTAAPPSVRLPWTGAARLSVAEPALLPGLTMMLYVPSRGSGGICTPWPLPVIGAEVVSRLPSGSKTLMVALAMESAEMPMASNCPCEASKSIKAELPEDTVTLAVPPTVMRPLEPMAPYPDGGMMKSVLLIACPKGVETTILPEVAPGGTVLVRLVALAVETGAQV